MCGIFGYCNYLVERSRGEIIDTLVDGLQRLEYRGYDSTGIAIDGDEADSTFIYKQIGKVSALKEEITKQNPNRDVTFVSHCGIAHTRWATHVDQNKLTVTLKDLTQKTNLWSFIMVSSQILEN